MDIHAHQSRKQSQPGAINHDPARFKARKEPKSKPLGNPSRRLTDIQIEAWNAFKAEMPWLMEGDRSLVEVASRLRAAVWSNSDIDIKVVTQLRQCLTLMGGTPADRSRVMVPDGEDKENPADEFLN